MVEKSEESSIGEMTVNQFMEMEVNKNYTADYLTRLRLNQAQGNRDFYEIFGYKRELTDADYYERYQRGDISKRIINAYPSATWSNPPVVTDDVESAEDSDWDKQWKRIVKDFKVYPTLKRFDTLTGLGEYAILIFGVANTGSLKEPMNLKGRKKPKLSYLRCTDRRILRSRSLRKTSIALDLVYLLSMRFRRKLRQVMLEPRSQHFKFITLAFYTMRKMF